jgi:hypothetical protein
VNAFSFPEPFHLRYPVVSNRRPEVLFELRQSFLWRDFDCESLAVKTAGRKSLGLFGCHTFTVLL